MEKEEIEYTDNPMILDMNEIQSRLYVMDGIVTDGGLVNKKFHGLSPSFFMFDAQQIKPFCQAL